ncbi:MAG: CpsD/CapB family tyrosine-protein kinase [Clostridia bacterium]|nr:CpsD/CapB family tyrosine-protein kinase [Clostridia bacterium]
MPKRIGSSNGQRPIASTFQIVEAYKTIRTNLLFALAPADNKVVVISSAEPNAGKSTVSCNLAITMAQTGAHVLLIDADMRKPSQHKTFRVKKSNGLSRILSGQADVEDCICREVARGLDLIPSGSLPPNPSELLGSDAMVELLDRLSVQYDYIFIDTPPLGVVADSLVLCSVSAGTVLVTRQGQTTYEELQTAIDSVRGVEGNLLGVVISDMRENPRSYGRYEKYHYYKAYDYSYSTAPAETADK